MIITENDCIKIIASATGSQNQAIGMKSFKVSPLSAGVTGFLGNHLKLDLQLDLDQLNKEDKSKLSDTIKAFIKSMPTSPDHEKYVLETNAFQKEYHNFDRLFPSLQNISKKFNHKWAPDCYLTKNNMLVFEDLTEAGYRMTENSKLMDFAHLKVAARALAYFHSASFIFEALPPDNGKKNNIKEEYASCVAENSFSEDPNNIRYHWFNVGVGIIIKMVKEIAKYSEDDVIVIEKKLFQMKNQIKAFFRTSATKTNVICHGDLWVNNFMFRYEKDCPAQCCLVDFQMTRYAPGGLDLTCMLYLCADKATRDEFGCQVIRVYEQAFNQQIREANIEPPSTNFTEDYQHFRPAALVEAILFEMITRMDEQATTESFTNPEEFFYGDRSNIVLSVFDRDVEYRKRLTELIEELVDEFVQI